MTHISVIGQTLSSQGMLDHGITAMLVHETASGTVLYTTSGHNGGVAAYAIDGAGAATLIDFAQFDAAFAGNVMHNLTLLETPGGPRLVVAGDPDGSLTSYSIASDGTLGAVGAISGLTGGAGSAVLDIDQWGSDMLFIANAGSGSIQGYGMGATSALTQAFSIADTQTTYADSVFALETVSLAGIDYLIGACAVDHGVTAYRIDTDRLVPTGNLGIAEGIGIMTPTALETASAGGRSFVLVGSAPGDGLGQSGAITVMELLSDGQLVPTDHITDTLNTRFGTIQSLDVVTSNGFTYVIAAGGDDGLTVFILMPNGRLQLIGVLADGHDTGLENVSAIASHDNGDGLYLFVSSEISAGVTELFLDTGRNGTIVLSDEAGGAELGTALDDIMLGGAGADHLQGSHGNDILEDGGGQDTLSGGDGSDIFVLRGDGETDTIVDFELNRDRIDLSDWPFFYDPSQLTVQSTSYGAIVTWRGETLVIQTLQGVTLAAADVIRSILQTPDRSPILFDLPQGDPSEILTGTPGDDSIDGADGHDTITGLDGSDTLLGGAGDDSLDGGDGNDLLVGGLDDDLLNGGLGFDHITGGLGNDTLLGGGGLDTLIGGEGADLLVGNMGADELWGEAGDDLLNGGFHDDLLVGGAGNDTLLGGPGRDTLRGGAGADMMRGGGGDDLLEGSGGADILIGQDGDDLMFGDEGDDVIVGGSGHDTGHGGLGNDEMLGLLGNDMLYGDAGDDALFGGHGNDLLDGGDGSDVLQGGLHNDTMLGGSGGDLLRGGDGNDLLDGGANADFLAGNGGHDTIIGGHGHDFIFGGGGFDLLLGGDGNDRMFGGTGADIMSGDAGDDVLSGSFGFDTLTGGAGNDLLTGDMDGDTFVFADGHGIDTITDFNAFNPSEVIDLSSVTAIRTLAHVLSASTQVGSDVRIETGDGNEIWLLGVNLAALDASDFLF